MCNDTIIELLFDNPSRSVFVRYATLNEEKQNKNLNFSGTR